MGEPIAFDGPMIRTTDLRKTFTLPPLDGRGRARRRPRGRVAGEIFGFLGPNGAGKTTTLRMLATLIPPDVGRRVGRRRAICRRDPAEVRRRIGYVPQGGSTDPGRDGTRRARPAGAPVRHVGRGGEGARRRGPRDARAGRRRRPGHLDVLGGHEAPARRRPRHRPSPARALPRRAHDRARPAGPRADVGRGPPAPRAGDHGLPDDPLSRRGRRARGPARDHRPRHDRGRGDLGRAEAAGRRRRRHARRRWRPRPRHRPGVRPPLRPRGHARGRPRPPLRRPRRGRRARSCCASSMARA